MGLGSFFSKIFGSSESGPSKTAAEPLEYKGYLIIAEPVNEGGQYRTSGRISKSIDGSVKETRFIRADNNSDLQSAIEHCQYKGKQIIDEQGDSMFEREMV